MVRIVRACERNPLRSRLEFVCSTSRSLDRTLFAFDSHVAASRAPAGMNPTESHETYGRVGILAECERYASGLADVNHCGLGWSLCAQQVGPSTALCSRLIRM